jgi:mannose-6-phosphate isomerase-like protein (cupin superfamily)
MKLLETHIPELIDFTEIVSENGNLWFAEVNDQLPFLVKRVYYIVGVPAGSERGAHAHKYLDQLLIPMTGSFTVDIADGANEWTFDLNNPGKALFLPAGVWRTLRNFSDGSICLVLASECYEDQDYIREYEEFLFWRSQHMSIVDQRKSTQ